jgi:leucyl-tRNA synthetase
MKEYNFKSNEKKWAEFWVENKTFTPDLEKAKDPYYALFMFPYPSAEGLHIGNFYAFTCVDVMAKYMKLKGKDVFEPFGFDAFGMHLENYALKIGEKPQIVEKRTTKNFRKQVQAAGLSCDYTREVDTTTPEYYKWTQWIFTKLFEKGIAYQKEALLNWCPSCKTVLADEQIEDGVCERCKTAPEKKKMKQWFFKITDYAQRLLDGLSEMDWSEITKSAQKNWIGRSEGAEVKFKIKNKELKFEKEIEVFTTRPDTLFGATYFVLSPEHFLVKEITTPEQEKEVENYIKESATKSEMERTEGKEKTGVFTGSYAINPVNNEKLPIWIADYVLSSYGTGAIMAVPAHDERDFEFAKKYNLPIKEVVAPYKIFDLRNDRETEEREVVTAIVKNPKNNKYLCLDWKITDWKSFPAGGIKGEDIVKEAKREVLEETGYKNLKFIKQIGNSIFADYYRPHKDSNIRCNFKYLLFELIDEERDDVSKKEKEQHEIVWIEEDKVKSFINVWNLEVLWDRYKNGYSPYTEEGKAINSGFLDGLKTEEAKKKMIDWLEEKKLGVKKINYRLRDWCISRQRYWGPPIPIIHCDMCGSAAVPEKDLPVVLPEMEKDWEPAGDGRGPLAKVKEFIEVKCPKCGALAKREADVMDNFLDSAWYFFRYIDPKNENKIFDKELGKKWFPVDLYIGGNEHAVLHLMYTRFITMVLNDLGLVDFDNPFKRFRANGMILKDGKKMSKSKGNVINPEEYGEKVGYDALKTYILFLGPLSEDRSFSDKGVLGTKRWVEKISRLEEKVVSDFRDNDEVIKNLHKTIKMVSDDFEDQKYNTAVAKLMEMTNVLSKQKHISEEVWKKFLSLIAPFAPALAEEMWSLVGNKESIFKAKNWPEYDPELARDDVIEMVIQVNGKVREKIEVDAEISEKEIKKIAEESEAIKKWTTGKKIIKQIFIKGKLLNIVVK